MPEPHDTPLVSIIIPTYNRAHLIGETIQSVLDQTYTNWELIVVDDGSEDDTSGVVNSFNTPKIKYVKIDHTGYLGIVRNVGIRMAAGDYISFLDSDDLWRKDKLSHQLDLFHHHPEARLAISNGEIFGSSQRSAPDCENFLLGHLFWPILEEKRYVFYSPSLVFKRELVDEHGFMNESLSSGADTEFFLRISHACTGMFTNERLVMIRKHADNITERKGLERYDNTIAIVKAFHQKGFLSDTQFATLIYRYNYKVGLVHIKRNNNREAWLSFYNCIVVSPLSWKAWIRLFQSTFNRLLR